MGDVNSKTFYPSNDPSVIRGTINGQDTNTFVLPYGHPIDVMISSQDKDDAIVSAEINSSTGLITIGCVDDGGNTISSNFDMVFKAILKTQ